MDPLTQGVLGAALPQAGSNSRVVISAGLLGFLAGMAADLDVLIRSSSDPLLFLEYHRQFTHALVFIPIGGLLCAAVLHLLVGRRRGLAFRQTWVFCTLGYATHAVLDSCTTYGTQLFWPFSDARFAWNTISIVDPLFTLPLLVGVLLAAYLRRPGIARVALIWALVYMGAGLWQRNSAVNMGYELAAQRNHAVIRLEAKPSFANILVWKTVYETDKRFYVDAVRTGWSPKVFPGTSVAKLNVARDFPWLDMSTQQARDIERFRWFSNDYLAKDLSDSNRIIDVRYSLVPNEVAPLWSIGLSPARGPHAHVSYDVHRDMTPSRTAIFWAMLLGD